MNRPTLTIKMHNQKTITIELYPDKAPNSVNGLLWSLFKDSYDNMKISRIVPDFVLQPWYDESKMSLDYQYLIDGEFEANGYTKNDLSFTKYAVGLAGDGATISSASSFFIVVGDHCEPRLNGKFSCIGYVTSGFEEIERLVSVPLRKVDSGLENVSINEPVTDEIIEHISIELNGYQYQEPQQFLPEGYQA